MRKKLSGFPFGLPSVLLACTLLAASSLSFADQLWRCPGNVYTDTPTEAQKKADCTLLSGDNGVSVIPSRSAEDSSSSRPEERPSATQRFQAKEQAARNAAKNRQVQAQLNQAKKELNALEAEYNNGEPQRMGPEFKNYQMYLDRVERLKGQVASKKAEVERLESDYEASKEIEIEKYSY